MTHDTGLVEAVASDIKSAVRNARHEGWSTIIPMHAAEAAARAALDAINASGTHVVMPVEPTGRMTLAGKHAWCGFNESVIMGPLSPGRAEFTAIYKAMLTAAKEQP